MLRSLALVGMAAATLTVTASLTPATDPTTQTNDDEFIPWIEYPAPPQPYKLVHKFASVPVGVRQHPTLSKGNLYDRYVSYGAYGQ